LEDFLYKNVYCHAEIVQTQVRVRLELKSLFDAYARENSLLPERYRRRIKESGVHRIVCDYIAGMTDRFCQQQYETVCSPG